MLDSVDFLFFSSDVFRTSASIFFTLLFSPPPIQAWVPLHSTRPSPQATHPLCQAQCPLPTSLPEIRSLDS